MIKKHMILFFSVFILISCTEKNNNGKDNINVKKNEIELNVQTVNSDSEQPPALPETKSNPIVTPPVQSNEMPGISSFLSGRTELLSLPYSGFISCEGFKIGEVFIERISTVAEKEIIDISRNFLETMDSDRQIQFIEPDRRFEVIEYCKYFIKDKIEIRDFIFGRPQIESNESRVELILFPDLIHVFLYHSKVEGKWLINGIEADLRSVKNGNDEIEKWVPSIMPTQIGIY